jgi:hypothetical protein
VNIQTMILHCVFVCYKKYVFRPFSGNSTTLSGLLGLQRSMSVNKNHEDAVWKQIEKDGSAPFRGITLAYS